MKKEEKNLHIVYIITKLELGGAQKVCLSLFNELQSSGYLSRLISGTQGLLTDQIKNNPFVYLLPALKREISFHAILNEVKIFIHLVRYLKKLKKEYRHIVVHTHSTKAGILGRWAAFFAGIKIRVHTVHGYAFHQHQSKIVWCAIYLLELLTSFITTQFVCVSSYDVQIGVKLFPNFKKKYTIIRAAVDWHPFIDSIGKAEQSNRKLFTIGTVACFKKQKNLLDLINAFHYAHQKNSQLRLEIIGDGILRPDIEQCIAKLGITDVVRLHGWQANVAPIMIGWDAFALTSLWEGLPCAVIEARLLKLPVLSYNTGGIHDVIINNKNGFLYTQRDWHSLAEGIITLSTNQELYAKMQNYNDNLQDYTISSMVSKHISLYKELHT